MQNLPKGCVRIRNIIIDITDLTNEIADWYRLVGGSVIDEEWYNIRGTQLPRPCVSYNGNKRCHYGAGYVRLHFYAKDANVACMFLLKFSDKVITHNFKEYQEIEDGQINYY
jgi:hypothetical protein